MRTKDPNSPHSGWTGWESWSWDDEEPDGIREDVGICEECNGVCGAGEALCDRCRGSEDRDDV